MVERIEKRIKAVDTKRKRKDDLMLFQRIELKQVLLDIDMDEDDASLLT